MHNKFELGHNTVKATKKICYAKGEGAIDHRKQIVQEISLVLQKPQQSGKIR